MVTKRAIPWRQLVGDKERAEREVESGVLHRPSPDDISLLNVQLQEVCPEAKETWAQLWKVHDCRISTEGIPDFRTEELGRFNTHRNCALRTVKYEKVNVCMCECTERKRHSTIA